MDLVRPKGVADPRSRRWRRVFVDLPAMVGGRAPRPARVVDLSAVGCLLRSEAALDRGAVIDLSLELPDGALHVKARVAEGSVDGDSLPDSRPRFLAGLEFLGMAVTDELRLRSFVEKESKRRPGAHKTPS